MNKISKIVYCCLFFGVCCIPLATLPFTKNTEELENRALTENPKIITNGKLNSNFSQDFEKWFNERLPYRSQALSGANYIKSQIFSTPTANVITGKDGWLFYEDTTEDYMDTNPLSQQQLKSIAITMSLLQEYVNSLGGNFTFVVMPNKNTIYSEYMPDNYIKGNTDNLDRLYTYLDEYSVNYTDIKNLMLDNKQLDVYHKKDTHWNYMGALLGYNSIMDSLNREHKSYDSAGYTIENNWEGDLEKLLYPNNPSLDEQYYFDIEYDNFHFTQPVGVVDTQAQLKDFMSDAENGDNRFRIAKDIPNTGRYLYMVRDSFGRALLPFMIDNYDAATFVRTNMPEMTSVGTNCDMVYEIVQRNLENVVDTAPFMKAPFREISVNKTEFFQDCKVYVSHQSYGCRIYGTVDENLISEDGRIYIHLENQENNYTVEAFPIFESELLEGEQINSKIGFSLFLDESQISAGEYSISIICGNTSSENIGNYSK